MRGQCANSLLDTLGNKVKNKKFIHLFGWMKMGFFKPNVEKMKKDKDVNGLMKALKDKDLHVRSEAVLALQVIGDARAVESLIQALKDEHFDVRAGVVVALGKIGKPAVEPLIQALKDKESSVRSGAAAALGGTGDARAVEPLIQALKDEMWDFQLRAIAKEALEKLKGKET